METEEQYVLYILMRTDLPSMNAGKAMAQASHASNAFIHNHNNGIIAGTEIDKRGYEWQRETRQGFGTVLVLGATMDDIAHIHGEGGIGHTSCKHYMWGLVTDPTYPYIVNSEIAPLIYADIHTGESPIELESGDFLCLRKEVTCAYLFADKNDVRIQELLGELELHP